MTNTTYNTRQITEFYTVTREFLKIHKPFYSFSSNYIYYDWHYPTSRKVAGSSPDDVDFSIDLILPAALWLWGQLSL
jgi:hypothetical protein